jgi:hypothetical protein
LKIRQIKDRLVKEIDAILPDVFDAARKSPIAANDMQKAAAIAGIKRRERSFRKGFSVACAVIVITVLALAVSLPLLLNDAGVPSGGDDYSVLSLSLEYRGGATASAEGGDGDGFLSAAFVLNKVGVVTGIAAEPEDERVPLLLAGERIVGEYARGLAYKYVENAVKLGIIDSKAENCAVIVRMAGSNDALALSQRRNISLAIEDYFIETGVRAVVLSEELGRDRLIKFAGGDAGYDGSEATVSDLVLSVQPRARFSVLTADARDAFLNGDYAEMRDVLINELFAAIYALTEDFTDSFYSGNRELAFSRIRHMISVYEKEIADGNAYIDYCGDRLQVGKDDISAWHFISTLDSDDGILGTLKKAGAYASAEEMNAVEHFARRLKNLVLETIFRCPDKQGVNWDIIENALRTVAVNLNQYIGDAVTAQSFEDLCGVVRVGYEKVMGSYLGNFGELDSKTPEGYLADIEHVTEQRLICQRGSNMAQARAAEVNAGLEAWNSRSEYEEWAIGVKSNFTITFS